MVINGIEKVLPTIKAKYGNQSFETAKMSIILEMAYLLNPDGGQREGFPQLKFQAKNFIGHRKSMELLERYKNLAHQKDQKEVFDFIDKAKESIKYSQKELEEPDGEAKQLAMNVGDLNPPADLSE